MSRVDLGIGDPDRGPIDLTSGKVTVRAPAPEGAPAPDEAPEHRHGRMRPVVPEQDAVLDRPRPGRPESGPERRADEEPGA